jgi:hypothetical protein
MTFLRIVGPLLTILSAVVLAIALNGLWKAQRYLQANGINQPIPLDNRARLIVWAWTAAFFAGIALTILAYR